MEIVLWFCLVSVVGVYITTAIVDPDLWWHITAGRWMLAHGRVPDVDHWNLFGQGKRWVAYSWSNEIVMALADRWGGDHGLLTLQLCLGVLLACSFAYCYGRIASDWFLGALLGVVTCASVVSHFTLRPQSVVWVCFIWLLYHCDMSLKHGLTRPRAAGIFLCMMVWANTHLSAILGVSAVVCWLLPARGFKWQQLALPLKGAALALVATLCTPYLGYEWVIFFQKSSHPFIHASIVEFKPATILQVPTAILILLIGLAVALLVRAPRQARWPSLVLWAAFSLGGLAVVKFMPFAVIVAAAVVAQLWGAAEGKAEVLGNVGEGLVRLKQLYQRIPREGLSFLCICIIIVSVHRLWQHPLNTRRVPRQAVNFILEHQLPRPILNAFGDGGYLMYRLSDADGNVSQLVAIDGRTNVNDPGVMEKHEYALNGFRRWHEYLEVNNPNTVLWPVMGAFPSLLEASGGWCTVFRSGDEQFGFVVLVKKGYFEQHRDQLKSENC